MEQQTRFVRTHADLQKFLDEIASLSRSDLAADDYLGRFLQLTLTALGCQGGAIWVTQEAEFQRACSVKFGESAYDSNELQRRSIHHALRDAAQNRRPLVVGPLETEAAVQEPKANGIINHTPYPFFYVPIIVAELSGASAVLAVLQVWLSPTVDPKSYKDYISFLQAAAKQAAVFLRARRIESLAGATEKLQQLLRFAAELNGQLDPAALAIAVVNWGREIIGCDRCALFAVDANGKLRALAVSNVEMVDQKSALVQSQMRLAQDALDAGQSTLYRKSSPKSEALGDISDYFFHSHASEAMAIPMAGRAGEKVGALLVESHKDKQIDDQMRKLATAVTAHAGRALGAAQEVAAIPLVKPLRRLAQARAALRSDRRKRLLVRVVAPVAALVLLAVCPWRFSVSGDCGVAPTVRARVVAEANGRLVEVLVDEGQRVEAGQRVARLDDGEIQQELTVLQQEKLKYQAEADRLEVLGDDGGRRVAEINAARTARQIEQVKRHLDQTYLRSPIAGVVLTKDLPSKVGEVLQVGSPFCEVADLSRWEVIVQLRESDVALVDAKLRKGQRLSVTFLLHGMPNQPFAATVENVAAISQMSYQVPRANVFLLKANVAATPQVREALKAGYSGSGKVRLGWRPAIYVVTRRFFAYVRTRWLF
ncbi:MAG: HlyD family efflux transporter periplasmic adaptor subunit [Verrucomicrobiia bacterium]